MASSLAKKIEKKTTNKIADRTSTLIVDKMFGSKKKKKEPAKETKSSGKSPAESESMGVRYNTKRCPECNSVCFDSPIECPYCHADLKAVKPMTQKELKALK